MMLLWIVAMCDSTGSTNIRYFNYSRQMAARCFNDHVVVNYTNLIMELLEVGVILQEVLISDRQVDGSITPTSKSSMIKLV